MGKLSILLNLLTPKMPAPQEEDLAKGILEAIDMDSYRTEKKAAMKIPLVDADAEIEPVPTDVHSWGQVLHDDSASHHARPDPKRVMQGRATIELKGPKRLNSNYRAFDNTVTARSLPCRARIGLQADAARPARTMVLEFPASPPSPSHEWERGASCAQMIVTQFRKYQ